MLIQVAAILGGLALVGFIVYRITVARAERSSFDAGTVSTQWLTEQRTGAQKDRFT